MSLANSHLNLLNEILFLREEYLSRHRSPDGSVPDPKARSRLRQIDTLIYNAVRQLPRQAGGTNVALSVVIEVVSDKAEIAKSNSPLAKPYLVIRFPDGSKQALTTNVAEMIGGAGKGVRERREAGLTGNTGLPRGVH